MPVLLDLAKDQLLSLSGSSTPVPDQVPHSPTSIQQILAQPPLGAPVCVPPPPLSPHSMELREGNPEASVLTSLELKNYIIHTIAFLRKGKRLYDADTITHRIFKHIGVSPQSSLPLLHQLVQEGTIWQILYNSSPTYRLLLDSGDSSRIKGKSQQHSSQRCPGSHNSGPFHSFPAIFPPPPQNIPSIRCHANS